MSTIYILYNYLIFRLFNYNFDGLVQFLGSIPNINEGGCGLAAYIMYKFNNNTGKIVAIDVLIKSSYKDYRCAKNIIAYHVVYKHPISKKYFDSSGIYNELIDYSNIYTYKEYQFISFYTTYFPKCMYSWNPKFKHRKLLIKLFKL